MEKLDAISVVIGLLGGGFGLYERYRTNRREEKKEEQSSLDLLYTQLEDLRKKIILQVQNDVAMASKVAERDIIIDSFRQHCPECYASFIEKYPHYAEGARDN